MAQIRVCHLIFIHEHNHSATISISTFSYTERTDKLGLLPAFSTFQFAYEDLMLTTYSGEEGHVKRLQGCQVNSLPVILKRRVRSCRHD